MESINKYIRNIKDFPKPGINFKDITPLLNNPKVVAQCLDALYDLTKKHKIDKVVGIESRGFFFATLLAQKLQAGFIPVRKPGKLPFKTISQSFNLEYGTDTLQIHEDAIAAGENVLIHDDVLATGGTAQAACKLVEKLGGKIVQCNFIMELQFLNGKEKLNYPVKSVLQY